MTYRTGATLRADVAGLERIPSTMMSLPGMFLSLVCGLFAWTGYELFVIPDVILSQPGPRDHGSSDRRARVPALDAGARSGAVEGGSNHQARHYRTTGRVRRAPRALWWTTDGVDDFAAIFGDAEPFDV
jgi:hypothetical protein